MDKIKRVIAGLVAIVTFISCIYFPLHTVAESHENLLKGASVSANPEYYNDWYEYNRPLSALTDGVNYVGIGYNAGNMLATPYAVDGTAFINFKLGSEITINKLVFYLVGSAAAPSNAVTDYAVDAKVADQSWKRIAEKHTDLFTEWDAKVETLCFEEVTTDEITITLKNAKGQSYAAIYEIEAFFDKSITSDDYTSFDTSEDILPMPTPINVLAGKTANCSSGYNDWYLYNRPVSKLTDENYVGSAAEMWASDYNDGYAYFEFNFDKEVSVNKVVTSFPGGAADVVDKPASGDAPAEIRQVRDYAVDGLLADGSWVRLAERHIDSNNEAADFYTDTVLFEAKTVKKLRFTFANAYDQQWVAVREVEAYHDSMLTPDKYTAIDCKDFTKYAIVKPEYKNLLENAEITANEAYYNGWYPDNRALSNLIDGKNFAGIGYNAGSAAVIPYEEDGYAYINFKLKEKSILNKLIIHFPGTSAYSKEQQVSAYAVEVKDGDEWKRVAVRNLENSDNWDAYSDTAVFNKAECEEFRIVFVKSKGQTEVTLFEIELYSDNKLIDSDVQLPELPNPQLPEPEIPAPEYGVTNIIKDSVEITANKAYYNGWYPDNRALSNLIDGNNFVGIGYNAGSATVIPYESDGYAYINFKLKEKSTLNKLTIYFPGTSAYSKEQQVSAYAVEVKNGSEWKRVAVRIIENSDNWDAYSDTAVFNKVECEEIRVVFVKSKGQNELSVFEIEGCYDSAIEDSSAEMPKLPDPEITETKPEEIPNKLDNVIKNSVEITANKAYYNGWYPDNRALSNLIDGKTFVGIGYNAGSAAVIPYEVDGDTYVNFKLKNKTAINQLVVYFPGTSAYSKEQQVKCYVVEVKTGGKWKRVAVRNIENSDNWDAYSDTATFNKVECNEIRVIFIKAKGQETVALFEIEAYYDPEQKDTNKPLESIPELPKNILKESTNITANDAYYNGWYPDNRALFNLIDGKTFVGVGYNAGSAAVIPYEVDGDTYVNFKLKNKTAINQLVIYFPGTSAYPKEQQIKCYVVEVKTGGEWKRVAVRNIEDSDNWDAYSDTATFNKVECEEIKVIFIKAKGLETVSLFEIEAYYDPEQKEINAPLESIPELPKNILKLASNITANEAYYNGWYPIYRSLSKAIDGNNSFKYDASKATMIPYGSDKLAYIQFEFSNVVKANRMTLYFPDAGENNTMTMENRITDYAVEVKLKNGGWTRIIEQHNERVDDWDIYFEDYLFETVEFTAMRFISKATDKQAYLAISELEMSYDSKSEDKTPYMERYVRGTLVYKTDIINNAMFGTKKEIEMQISSILSGIIPTIGLGDNSWYCTERPLENITDGIKDVFTPNKISTIDYHDSVAYYNFELSSPQKINTFRFFVPQASINSVEQRPTDFAVDLLLSDGTWKRVAEQHIKRNDFEEGYCEILTFKSEECVGIRLTSLAGEKTEYFALSEVEAYYDPHLKEDYTGINKASDSSREIPLPKIRFSPTPKFN